MAKSRELVRFLLLAFLVIGMACAFSSSAQAAPWTYLTGVSVATAGGTPVTLNPAFTQNNSDNNASSASVGSSVSSVNVTVAVDPVPPKVTINGDEVLMLELPLGAPGTSTIIKVEAYFSLVAPPTDTYTITITRAGGVDPSVPVTGLVVSPKVMSLDLHGKSKDNVVGAISPAGATNKQILWKVEPAGVVALAHTSGESGTPIGVTALKQGTATITGTSWEGNHSDTCVVTVGEAPFAVVPPQLTLLVQGLEQLETVNAIGAVTWRSSAPEIATVDGWGWVRAIAVGSATIAATDSAGREATSAVTVAQPSSLTVVVSPKETSVMSGDGVTFTATASGGTTPYAYQWAKNGSILAEATGSTFAIARMGAENAGTYTCTVTDALGATASDSGVLTLATGAKLSLTVSDIEETTCKLVAKLTDANGKGILGRTVEISITGVKKSSGVTDVEGQWTWGVFGLIQETGYTAIASSSGAADARPPLRRVMIHAVAAAACPIPAEGAERGLTRPCSCLWLARSWVPAW